jgi:hypothetical protein
MRGTERLLVEYSNATTRQRDYPPNSEKRAGTQVRYVPWLLTTYGHVTSCGHTEAESICFDDLLRGESRQRSD